MFKVSTDFHIKTSRSRKRRAILKIPIPLPLSVDFKMNPLRKRVMTRQSVKTKTNSNFAVKPAE